ncbi:hypothetical protein [Halorussus lipolyticus]|uniref:hypothetical protein n=1 Tax=Halorussus lipolyticus TaxID=3034024 RepID=UPI0023E8ABD4|nr:hypothetical protein [Halorussus sp. DT80]
MADDIFRITVDEPNYSRVLGTPPEDSLLEDAGLLDFRQSRLWAQKGSEEGEQVYAAIESGDGLLFYKVQRGHAEDEGRYVGVGRVGETKRLTEEQAETLFHTPLARLAYTVTDFEPISKSIVDVETVLGYGSYPQSSHRVTDDRYSSVDSALQTLSE